tara:strand:+ start:426 stop:1988 length:1563 start_codon:yes stop_codon:yes gene_type:complete
VKNIKNKALIIVDFCQSPIIEISGEVACKLLEKNSNVEILIVDDYLPSDGFSRRLPKLFDWFDIPLTFKRIFLKKASSNIKFTHKVIQKNIPYYDWPLCLKNSFEKINTNRELSIKEILDNIKLNNVDIGAGILSSIISNSKDNNPNYSTYKKVIDKAFNEFARRYSFFINYFNNNYNYDELFIFNGRLASNKSLLSALSYFKKDLKIFYYERSHILDTYTIRDFMPHDRFRIYEEINKYWKNVSSLKEAKLIAETYFRQRINGNGLSWYAYSTGINDKKSNQIIKSLFCNEKKEQKKIVFFSSSEDEFESLGEKWYRGKEKLRQFEIIENISQFVDSKGYKLFIRIHPNFKISSNRVKNKWINFLQKIRSENTEIISYDSKISSYGIIEKMDLVVVYGSTIGIEAAYLGKEVIVTGPSYYSQINAKINVINNIEGLKNIMSEILNSEKINSDQISESTLPYGYWCYKSGIKFKNYIPASALNGKYYGKNLDFTLKILVKIKRIFGFPYDLFRKIKKITS